LICVTAKKPRTPSFRRACVSPNDISSVWRELISKVGLGRNSTKNEIADKVYKLWQSQHVLITFHGITSLNENHFQELLNDFWQLLINKIKSSNSIRNNSYRLLIFFIDYTGDFNSWNNLDFIEEYNPDWSVNKPVKLPELSKFQEYELTGWINNEVDSLPKQLCRNVNTVAKQILNDSQDGIPEFTLEEICKQCRYENEWCEKRQQWENKW